MSKHVWTFDLPRRRSTGDPSRYKADRRWAVDARSAPRPSGRSKTGTSRSIDMRGTTLYITIHNDAGLCGRRAYQSRPVNKDTDLFYILSIDGGGFRGLYAAHILHRMEEEWQLDWKRQFDMLAGTSTGAILVAGLSCGITAAKLFGVLPEPWTVDIYSPQTVSPKPVQVIPKPIFRRQTCKTPQ